MSIAKEIFDYKSDTNNFKFAKNNLLHDECVFNI